MWLRSYAACEPKFIASLQAESVRTNAAEGLRPWPLSGGTRGRPLRSYDVLLTGCVSSQPHALSTPPPSARPHAYSCPRLFLVVSQPHACAYTCC